jgi:hypothetical protein
MFYVVRVRKPRKPPVLPHPFRADAAIRETSQLTVPSARPLFQLKTNNAGSEFCGALCREGEEGFVRGVL